jgi:hypothetical protein
MAAFGMLYCLDENSEVAALWNDKLHVPQFCNFGRNGVPVV